MQVNSNNQLKFQEGSVTEPLKIMSAGVEELPFGSKYVVHIKQTIEGYDHFLPSNGLVKKMKEENIDVGDVITIEKAPKTDKYPYGYFSVKVVEKNTQGKAEVVNPDTGEVTSAKPLHKSIEKFKEQFDEPKFEEKMAYEKGFKDGGKGVKVDLHELTLRVEKLEKMVTVLSSEAGHKPGDEEIPF